MPEFNGITERFNHTVLEMVCMLLADSGLSHTFWAKVVTMATYIKNRAPTKANDGESPHE
jgi:hypothetical protein